VSNPYQVVEQFEAELCAYTGARYAVTTNSCSMAILLACASYPKTEITLPSKTYCSVPNSVLLAGHKVKFVDMPWNGAYNLYPTRVWDSARRFTSGMYQPGAFQCVSFQTSKILGLEQGGAILHDSEHGDAWLRRRRFDGRLDASEIMPKQRGWHCYMNPSTAAIGLQRLSCLPKHNPDQAGYMDFPDISKLDIWNA
jgi:dTDP-4-amino-4,6-dideoxygalactose transaminase